MIYDSYFANIVLLLIVFSFIIITGDKDEYKAILEYRTRLSDNKFYGLRRYANQLFEDYIKGKVGGKEWVKFLEEYDFPLGLTTGLEVILEGFATCMDITLPDDGPYDDLKADTYCRKKFGKYHKRACEKAIKTYYKKKNIVNPKNKPSYEITVDIRSHTDTLNFIKYYNKKA